jgi:hypothetical protein
VWVPSANLRRTVDLSTIMAAKLVRALYDFRAEETGELSVKAGQLLQLKGASARARLALPTLPLNAFFSFSPAEDGGASDGWVLAFVVGAPEVYGYVPSGYVSTVTPTVAATPTKSAWGSATTAARASTGVAAGSSMSASRFSSSVYSPTKSVGANPFSLSVLAASSYVPTGSAAGAAVEQEFAQLFASHEEWFRAASAKRGDTYRSLLAEAGDVLRAVQESEARSAAALERLSTLEKMVSDEKAKWSRAVGEEGMSFA